MIIEIALKNEKAQVGPNVSFLGIEGTFPHAANGMQREMLRNAEKPRKWAAHVQEIPALTPLAMSISKG